jgi:hypothetical protein
MVTNVAISTLVSPGSSELQDHSIEIGLARTEADLTGAFRLLYQSYLRAGLGEENAIGMRITPFHLLPSTEVLVAKHHGEVISTLSIVADSDAGLPMESMYSDEVAKLRSRSMRIAEMGSFADRRETPVRFAKLFAELARLIVQVAESREIDALVLAAHPRHAKLYARSLGFEQIGDLTSCPYAQGNPAVCLLLDFDRVRGSDAHNLLVSEAVTPEQLARTEWSSDTREYLRYLYDQQLPASRVRKVG